MKLTIKTPLGDVEAALSNEPVDVVANGLQNIIRDGVELLALTTSDGGRVIIPRETLLNSVITISEK